MSNELPGAMSQDPGSDQARAVANRYVPQTGWPAWAAAVAVFLILAVSVISADGVRAIAATLGLADANWLLAIALLASQVVGITLTLIAANRFASRPVAALALGPPARGWWDYVWAFALMLALFGAFSAVTWMLDPEAAKRDLSVFGDLLRSDAWWLALIAIGLGAPLMEELMFRGFLFSAFSQSRLGIAGASVLTAAGWTALHAGYSPVGLAEVFAVGIYFSWVLSRTGSVRVPLFCHAAYNLSVVAFLMSVDIRLATPA